MRPSNWLIALRLLTLLALGASAALYVDYTAPQATFCGVGSGCAAIRSSGMGYMALGGVRVPVPVLGLAGFGVLFLASLVPHERRRKLLVPLTALGALTAAVLLVIQGVTLGRFCTLCVVTDVSALLAFGAALGYQRATRPPAEVTVPPGDDLRLWAWIALAALAVGAPVVWPQVRSTPPVPDTVLALYKPGKINVVEFADYECPFCRLLHERLKPLLAPYGDRVNLVRLNYPLASHPHARGAARGAVCARAQGKGDAMADALFKAGDLSTAGVRQQAVGLGLDMTRFDACLADPATDRIIDGEAKILRDIGLQGLPTTFVGQKQIVGAHPDEVFQEALEAAARDDTLGGVDLVRFAMAVLGLAIIIYMFGRPRPERARKRRMGPSAPNA